MIASITNEQEAAVAILFSCVMQEENRVTEQQIEQLSRALVLCSRFRGTNLNELSQQAFTLQSTHTTKDIIETAVPFIDEAFRETLFAMVSEVLLMDGQITDARTKVLAMLALYMDIQMDRMKMILATYLIRNKWNVQVIDQPETPLN
jgi:hypothetical protein